MKRCAAPRIFLVGLVLLNMLGAPAWTQQPPSGLRIVIVEGDGAINNIRQRINREPIVQVEDENHKPVAGAVVLFFLPDQGPSGTFTNGSRMLMTVTDAQGQARPSGIRPQQPKPPGLLMQIRVTASFLGITASAVIAQTNVAGAAPRLSASAVSSTTAKIWLIVGIAGGAAAAGIIVATHNSSSGPPAIVLTPGTPTVGAP